MVCKFYVRKHINNNKKKQQNKQTESIGATAYTAALTTLTQKEGERYEKKNITCTRQHSETKVKEHRNFQVFQKIIYSYAFVKA